MASKVLVQDGLLISWCDLNSGRLVCFAIILFNIIELQHVDMGREKKEKLCL